VSRHSYVIDAKKRAHPQGFHSQLGKWSEGGGQYSWKTNFLRGLEDFLHPDLPKLGDW